MIWKTIDRVTDVWDRFMFWDLSPIVLGLAITALVTGGVLALAAWSS